jgi:hypothetical protein
MEGWSSLKLDQIVGRDGYGVPATIEAEEQAKKMEKA